ncbi:hypothetical protein [Streptomyces violascens]|uniref:Uncharacterized protein n=1 Tax=Streptomyces violascens TaxID=67381 RepID=A0ABQ3QRX3_9ACTN|nr:hypothetical protein [Streptomyces violascens]GGT84524.1 hypothetical protein GCM10010289_00020 [Streptomyces violascens]GHI40040.1 hypothetical protein Sviol_44480 [Streptomyces violascens]
MSMNSEYQEQQKFKKQLFSDQDGKDDAEEQQNAQQVQDTGDENDEYGQER